MIDRLCDSGLIERRSDPNDRRAKRLFLTPAAKPVLEKVTAAGEAMMASVLVDLDPSAREAMRASLTSIKSNLRQIIAGRTEPDLSDRDALERRYG
jgi:MarR family transcriptional regulator for hemolysin